MDWFHFFLLMVLLIFIIFYFQNPPDFDKIHKDPVNYWTKKRERDKRDEFDNGI